MGLRPLGRKIAHILARLGHSYVELDFWGLVQDDASPSDVADSRAVSLPKMLARARSEMAKFVRFRTAGGAGVS